MLTLSEAVAVSATQLARPVRLRRFPSFRFNQVQMLTKKQNIRALENKKQIPIENSERSRKVGKLFVLTN